MRKKRVRIPTPLSLLFLVLQEVFISLPPVQKMDFNLSWDLNEVQVF